MKQNEIIEMARQAGLHVATDVNWMPIIGLEYAEKLIALARADEREACAAILDANAMACQSPIMRSLLQSNAQAIRVRGQA
jgi:hypothetical protein